MWCCVVLRRDILCCGVRHDLLYSVMFYVVLCGVVSLSGTSVTIQPTTFVNMTAGFLASTEYQFCISCEISINYHSV